MNICLRVYVAVELKSPKTAFVNYEIVEDLTQLYRVLLEQVSAPGCVKSKEQIHSTECENIIIC